MFCRNCGAQNEDGANVCASCGTPLNGTAQAAPAAPKAGKKLSIPVIAAVAAVVVLLFAVLNMGKKTPKSVVEKFMKGCFEADGKSVVALLPEKVVKEYCDRQGQTQNQYAKSFSESLERLTDSLDDEYDKWRYSVKVLDEEKITGDTLEDLADNYDDYFDLKISEARKMTVKLTLTADGNTESENLTLVVIKAGGSWFLDASSFYSNINSFARSF